MKRKVFFMLVFYSLFVNAQRMSNQFSIVAKTGIVNNFKNFGGSIGISYVFENSMMGESNLNYHTADLKYLESELNYEMYSLELLAGYTIEKENLYPFFFNLKGGVFAGYEIVNDDSSYESLYSTKLPYQTNNFVYGISLNPEIEFVLNEKFALITNFNQYFNLKSEYKKNYFTAFLGIKYYL